MSHKPWIVVCVFALGIVSLACGIITGGSTSTSTAVGPSWHPPLTFQESDLIGTWEKSRKGSDTETLMIMADKTIKQVYDDSTDSYHFEGDGSWRIEYRPSGCVYVHAEGIRYYYRLRSDAEAGNRDSSGEPILFWDPCEKRVVTMLDSIILIVGSYSNFPRGILLSHMALEIDSSVQILQLASTLAPE